MSASRKRCSSMGEEGSCERDRLLERTEAVTVRFAGTRGEGNHLFDEISHSQNDQNFQEGNHCHRGKKGPDIDRKAKRKLMIACLLSLIFMIGEIVGGILAHSLAIVSDAAHLLTDLASFLISLVAIYLASRPASKKLSFGWSRAEILGALVSILLLWVLTGVLVYMGVERVMDQTYQIDATVMLITAGCGVAFNLIMGLSLHQHTHHSLHNHDQDTEVDRYSAPIVSLVENETSYGTVQLENNSSDLSQTCDKKHDEKQHFNLNVKAAFIHVVGDLVQSIGVLVAAFIIFFKPEWKLADPICTFLFSILVLFTTITILRDILVVLMEGTPRGMSMDLIKSSFLEIDGVCDIHDLRVWSLSLSKIALSVHLAVKAGTDPMHILSEATAKIQREFGITETTIQVEAFVDDMVNCTMCKDLID
ncbi:hypothetical protein CHS0354_027008 [Potamilus streckersoni]|uniref:Zinc transporter 2-like n=1 Tax=Potamilus streckersoni TaxID=2493646 RepID=A0AAE0SRQ9_9BIVA|nr:hypothetical protein CHS0354_027008 [Potamilus streckersoni]